MPVYALLTFVLALAAGQAAPFDPARLTIDDPGGAVMPYLGQPSIFLDNGVARLRDSAFADGAIDVDVALHGHASFAGILFRGAAAADYELVYVRPHRSREWDALQYTPIFNGSEAWQLYSGKGYTAPAELPANRWVHLRLLVKGYSAKLYVDHASEPQLDITDLKRPWARGQVGLWGRLGGANFTNLVVTPSAGTAPTREPDPPAAPGLVTSWELSQVLDAAAVPARALPTPGAANSIQWTPVNAEPSGLVNIARFRQPVVARQAAPAPGSRDVVFARTVVTAAAAKRVRLVFAYSDAVRIFLNGRPLFEGDARFRSRDPGFLGVASLGPDAIYLDLAPGRNELVFAVVETFGGWGLAARIESD